MRCGRPVGFDRLLVATLNDATVASDYSVQPAPWSLRPPFTFSSNKAISRKITGDKVDRRAFVVDEGLSPVSGFNQGRTIQDRRARWSRRRSQARIRPKSQGHAGMEADGCPRPFFATPALAENAGHSLCRPRRLPAVPSRLAAVDFRPFRSPPPPCGLRKPLASSVRIR